MRVLNLNCNHCGAPLAIPKRANFVTCEFCDARLKVVQEGGVAFTEVLGEVAERTRRIEEDVETIRLQNELERVDREWKLEAEGYKVRGKNGESNVPTKAGGAIGMIVAVVFALFWIGFASSMGAPPIFPLFGVLFIVVAVAGGASSIAKAGKYGQRHSEYQRQRRRLMDEIDNRPS